MSIWIALRRPLLLAFAFGCAVSLMASGRLTLRLVIPATIYWSFIPLCEIASLAVVARRRKAPFGEMIDTFFTGQTVWLLLLAAYTATVAWGGPGSYSRWLPAAFGALAWSAYVDFGFFRRVLGRSRVEAARDLLIQRLLCWIPVIAIFTGPPGWQVAASALGL